MLVNERAALERLEQVVRRLCPVVEPRRGPRPERRADNRRVLGEPPLRRGQPVQAGRDERLQALGHRRATRARPGRASPPRAASARSPRGTAGCRARCESGVRSSPAAAPARPDRRRARRRAHRSRSALSSSRVITVRRSPSTTRPACRSLISGRAVASTNSGARAARSDSSSSIRVGSAQWRSSSSSTSGRWAASSSNRRWMPQCSSAWEICVVAYVPRGVVCAPTRFETAEAIVRSWSRSSTASRLSSASSFVETTGPPSPARIPAAARTICAMGQ